MAKTVLIIEDNQDNRDIYTAMLEHGGYRVVEAVDAQSGLAALDAEMPDLLLLDLGLPRISGWDLLRTLRTRREFDALPLCILSAHIPREDDVAMTASLGVVCYLLKPITPRAVLEKVAELIGPA